MSKISGKANFFQTGCRIDKPHSALWPLFLSFMLCFGLLIPKTTLANNSQLIFSSEPKKLQQNFSQESYQVARRYRRCVYSVRRCYTKRVCTMRASRNWSYHNRHRGYRYGRYYGSQGHCIRWGARRYCRYICAHWR